MRGSLNPVLRLFATDVRQGETIPTRNLLKTGSIRNNNNRGRPEPREERRNEAERDR